MKLIHTLFFLQFTICFVSAQSKFSKYFHEDKLRFDYSISGDSEKANIQSRAFYLDKNWGGSLINSIDTFLYGELLLEVFDSATNKLIYSRGYSTLFKEWQTIDEADTTKREFLESVIMPFPKNTVKIEISERRFDLSFKDLFSTYFNPKKSAVLLKKTPDFVVTREIIHNGRASSKLDLVFLSAGYQKGDSTKFFSDVNRTVQALFKWDPYSKYKQSINVYATFVSSDHISVCDQKDSIVQKDIIQVNFNTFNSERYLTTEDIQGVRDVLCGVPYDQICIIANSNKYGGGGIYNFLTFFTADNEYSEFLFHHEFGHGFVALADEYYSSLVPYTSFVKMEYEPYEPNITTRIEFNKKWEAMVSDTVPIPTPNSTLYSGVIGLFEGGAYSSKGVFRPYFDCTMKSKIDNAFCPVCQKAIEHMILFYSAE